jgi:hypothetical protein
MNEQTTSALLSPDSVESQAGALASEHLAEYAGEAILEDTVSAEEKLSLEPDALIEHLPEQVTGRVEARILAKESDRQEQKAGLDAVKAEFTTGLTGKWIKEGVLRPRSLVEKPETLSESLQEAAEEYAETVAGQKDLLIKNLRDFLAKPVLNREDIAAIDIHMGNRTSQRKLKLVPGHAAKAGQALRQQAEAKLDQLAPPPASWDDKKTSWQDAAHYEKQIVGNGLIGDLRELGSGGYQHALRKFSETYHGASTSRWAPETGLDKLHDDIAVVDVAHKNATQVLAESVLKSTDILSLITRGSLSSADVVAALAQTDQFDKKALYGMFDNFLAPEWRRSIIRTPEPSLVGLRVTAQDIESEAGCLEQITELAELCGVVPPDSVESGKRQIEGAVSRTQKLFYARLESPNSLYWHFSRRGLDIIESGKLDSEGGEAGRNTGEWSKGVHFVKPGFGINTEASYYTYATGNRTNAGQSIPDALGVAVLYPLGSIIERTPIRDEPLTERLRGKANVSEDVTFRDKNGGSEYQYSLDGAYILPMADWKQLNQLRDQGQYTDLFEPGKPITRIAYEITERALREAGRSEEWIAKHLLTAEELVDPALLDEYRSDEAKEVQLFNKVAHKIHNSDSEDAKIVVPLSAKWGSAEAHDGTMGSMPELWQDELVVVNT